MFIINNKNKHIYIFKLCVSIMAVLSLVISIYCGLFSTSDYSLLFLLPFVSSIGFILYALVFYSDSLSVIVLNAIVLGLYFIRNSVSSYVLIIDNYNSKFTRLDFKSISGACLLMIYETVVVLVFLYFCSKRFKAVRIKERNSRNNTLLLFIIIPVSLGIIILALINSKALLYSFYSIFYSDFSRGVSDNSYLQGSGLSRVLYTGGSFLINSLRLIVPLMIICYLSKFKSVITLIICLFISTIQLLFMTDSNLFVFLLVAVQMITILRLYSHYDKLIMVFMIFVGVFVVSMVLANRFMYTGYAKSFSMFLQSYFPGITEIAGGIKMIEGNEANKLALFWEDIYSNVPFRSTLFGYRGGGIRLAEYFNSFCGTNSQILPSTIESSYYFSYIFAPFSSCFSIKIAFSFLNKRDSTNNVLLYALYTLIVIVCSFAPITFDLRIVLHYFTSYFILMFFYSNLTKGISVFSFERSDEKKGGII